MPRLSPIKDYDPVESDRARRWILGLLPKDSGWSLHGHKSCLVDDQGRSCMVWVSPMHDGQLLLAMDANGVPAGAPGPVHAVLMVGADHRHVWMVPVQSLMAMVQAGKVASQWSSPWLFVRMSMEASEWTVAVESVASYAASRVGDPDRFCHLHAHSMYCLAGDAVVDMGEGSGPGHTIAQLHGMFLDAQPCPKVKVFDGRGFVPAAIKGVSHSGVKDVYEIRTFEGKVVRATMLHRFLTDRGWMRMNQIKAGDTLMCDGGWAGHDAIALMELVVSITYVGMMDTYDLEVDHPAHNFTANGIVTHNSFLDGVSSPKDMVGCAKANGQSAIALTDHGHMMATFKFHNECKRQGIKPIHGIEAYLVEDVRKKGYRDHEGKVHRFEHHITLLAMDDEGWRNLCWLNSEGAEKHFHHVPRIDHDMLFSHNAGIICLSGCFKGPVAHHLQDHGPQSVHHWMRRDPDKARDWMVRAKQAFGDRLYAEVMSIDFQRYMACVPDILNVAADVGVPAVVTCDAHYPRAEDAKIQRLMGRIKKSADDELGDVGCYYIKSRDEISHPLFTPDMFDRTCEIADRCNVSALDFTGFMFPEVKIEDDADWAAFVAAGGVA